MSAIVRQEDSCFRGGERQDFRIRHCAICFPCIDRSYDVMSQSAQFQDCLNRKILIRIETRH